MRNKTKEGKIIMEKRKSRIFGILLSVITIICCMVAFSACGEDPVDPPPGSQHDHTYSSDWSKDDTDHWHDATCEHTTEKKDKASHDTTGEGGSCSVCGYAPAVHEHTYNMDAWTIGADTHWHAATCEHTEEKADEVAHNYGSVGTNKEFTCSICGYIKPHTHNYEAKYEYTTVTHWQKATCCKDPEERYTSIAKHDTSGADGKCSVCGYVESWNYSGDDCIVCADCGGCLREDGGAHAEKAGHKKCGDGLKVNEFEAEDAVLKDGAWPAGLSNSKKYMCTYLSGVRGSGGVGVTYNISSSKECTVTLRVCCGNGTDGGKFTDEMSVLVNGTRMDSGALIAHNTRGTEDAKCSFAWLTIGCIKLSAGDNQIRIIAQGKEGGTNLDKIALLTASDVTLTFEKTDNSSKF